MRRHVILTIGRSGSNTLRDMLNQSPEVLNFGEVLGEWNAVRKLQRRLGLFRGADAAYLDFILGARTFRFAANTHRSWSKRRAGQPQAVKRLRDVRTVGIKDFSLNFQRYGLMDYLPARPDIKVVGLIRDDVVGRMISNARLGATGVVALQAGQSGPGGGTLRIEPGRIGEMLATIERENALLAEMLEALPAENRLVVRYDDLYRSPEARNAVMEEVFGFLGVPPVATAERMRKIITAPVSEVIENFDACLHAVRGTPHEALLLRAAERG